MDLAQVQNRPLYGLAARQPMILDDAEIAVILAVFPAVGAAQKHRKQQNARVRPRRKEGRSSLSGFRYPCVAGKRLAARADAKSRRNCEGQARPGGLSSVMVLHTPVRGRSGRSAVVGCRKSSLDISRFHGNRTAARAPPTPRCRVGPASTRTSSRLTTSPATPIPSCPSRRCSCWRLVA